MATGMGDGPMMIRVTDFSKAYGRTVAVDGISFDVGGGQILGLLGPNGAGKTTTLRTLAGILLPTRGQLWVDGCDVVRQAICAKQRLAYVPDEPGLFEALTVWEHLQFTAAVYRIRDFASQANELLQRFELDSQRDLVVHELSRGMRQKVAIVCAYLQAPRAMVFDEPLTGLDPRGIHTVKESIRQHAAAGMTAIVSSHLLPLVEDLCTQLLVLHQGRVRFQGSIDQARALLAGSQRPASLEEVFFQITRDDQR